MNGSVCNLGKRLQWGHIDSQVFAKMENVFTHTSTSAAEHSILKQVIVLLK